MLTKKLEKQLYSFITTFTWPEAVVRRCFVKKKKIGKIYGKTLVPVVQHTLRMKSFQNKITTKSEQKNIFESHYVKSGIEFIFQKENSFNTSHEVKSGFHL